MPLIAALLLVIALVALMVVMIPLSLVMRYRGGTARRPARRWVITLNLYAATISSLIFLAGAAFSSMWIPRAFTYSALGLLGGFAAGVLGLALTRWEVTPHSLHYRPSRLLVLSLTLLVVTRLIYGFWRAWNAWQSASDTTAWIAQSGAAGSLAAGAIVLGYYVVYWAGVRRRFAWYRSMTGRGVPTAPPKPRA